MAREVRFTITPGLVTTGGDQWNVMALQIFTSGIESLAPGRVIEFFFDTWIGRDEKDDRATVAISYRGDGKRQYHDVLDLDLGVFRNTHFIHKHDVDDIYKQLDRIAKALESFRADWGDGLLALSPKDLAARHEELKRSVEEWNAKREAPSPITAGADRPQSGNDESRPAAD